jgi:hypothetical protein
MTFARENVTASILNSRAHFHRMRAERFGVHASRSQNADSRAMYLQLAARETAIAERLERQPPKRAQLPLATQTTPEKSRGPRRFPFRMNPRANVTTVRATVASAGNGYALAVVLEKNGQAHTLAEKTVVSRVEAETVAIEFAALHGVPWHKVEVLYR